MRISSSMNARAALASIVFISSLYIVSGRSAPISDGDRTQLLPAPLVCSSSSSSSSHYSSISHSSRLVVLVVAVITVVITVVVIIE